MNAIYQCGFAISDITLFLDTHPKDPDALDYFQHMKHKYNHFGGPDGELSASMRYLSQRYAMPYREVAGLLTDIGTEEFAQRRWK